MHEHTLMHEDPMFFHFHYLLIQSRWHFVHILSFFISFLISLIISFVISLMHTLELHFMLVRRFACQSYHIIQIT